MKQNFCFPKRKSSEEETNENMEEKLAIYTESKRHLVVSTTQSFLKEPGKSFSELCHPFYLVSYQFE